MTFGPAPSSKFCVAQDADGTTTCPHPTHPVVCGHDTLSGEQGSVKGAAVGPDEHQDTHSLVGLADQQLAYAGGGEGQTRFRLAQQNRWTN